MSSTFNSREICGRCFFVSSYFLTEVYEITLKPELRDNSVINSSVIASAKYSWEGSPERFCSGSTAMALPTLPCHPGGQRCQTTCDEAQEKSRDQAGAMFGLQGRRHRWGYGFC